MFLGLDELREYRENENGLQVSPRGLSSPGSYYEGTNERYSTRCETWLDDNPEETPLPQFTLSADFESCLRKMKEEIENA